MASSGQLATCSSILGESPLEGSGSSTKLAFIFCLKDFQEWSHQSCKIKQIYVGNDEEY